jgi:hypothetical protein
MQHRGRAALQRRVKPLQKNRALALVERESILAFQKVSHLLPTEVPIILESRVEESEINEEIETALDALNPATRLAFASD